MADCQMFEVNIVLLFTYPKKNMVLIFLLLYKCKLQEVAESVKQDFGSIDILVHSLANGPEV